MALKPSTILFSFLVLVPLALNSVSATEYNHTEPPTEIKVVVEGVVYCQSCERLGSWSLTNAKPIPAAKVSVVCKSYKNRVSYYKVHETNANGYFYAQLDDYKRNHPILEHPLQSCKVKLVSSPLQKCNILTNINNGISGAPLRYEKKLLVGRNFKAVIYAAGPLAFRPNECIPANHN